MQMSGRHAALRRTALAGVSVLAAFLCGAHARAQAAPESRTFETIKVTGGRPVARAMDAIEERYGVLIDYVDPQYVAPEDLELVRSLHGRPLAVPFPAPKTWTISIQYWQVPGTPKSVAPIYRCTLATLGCAPVTAKPEEGIRALIQQVLDEFAGQGGQVFTVQKLEMPYGARWEVYPTEARDRSGTFVAQPDLLSAKISIPKARRWPEEMFELIAQQLTRAWGAKFSVALLWWTVDMRMPGPGERPPELGAENVSAWRAIADLMGPRATLGALRLFYGWADPGYGYGINIVSLPYREPPRPPTPAPVPARLGPPFPPYYWQGRALSPQGRLEIERALVKAGYLETLPTKKWVANAMAAQRRRVARGLGVTPIWDADTVAALRRFQAAAGIPQTGKFDLPTASALMRTGDLPVVHMVIPAKPAMSIALRYWLTSTRSGMKEVQRALTDAGFYNGPIDGHLYLPTIHALEAFQAASGLKPTGLLDWATAVKLAPFLPKPN
jgi:peptidoglycan hydrolase-like protein with peptidoglycan-binding domain